MNQTFSKLSHLGQSIVGHASNLNRLEGMIGAHRLPPVLLFVGPEGVGKRLVAKALGQRLVCENGRGCGACGPCKRVEKEESESVRQISPDGASIKVEQTRAVLEELSLQSSGKARIWIFDQAEKMSPQAANSLLKVFEEPPQNSFFILITSSQSQVLTTIRSRAQILRFMALSMEELRSLREAPEWAYVSAQGQVSKLDQLVQPALDELRKNAFRFLSLATQESQSWVHSQIKEHLPDRESALAVIGFWSQFLRDWTLQSCRLEPLIHRDLVGQLGPTLSPAVSAQLQSKFLQAERDLIGNVDRTLVFESLCRELREMAGTT